MAQTIKNKHIAARKDFGLSPSDASIDIKEAAAVLDSYKQWLGGKHPAISLLRDLALSTSRGAPRFKLDLSVVGEILTNADEWHACMRKLLESAASAKPPKSSADIEEIKHALRLSASIDEGFARLSKKPEKPKPLG